MNHQFDALLKAVLKDIKTRHTKGARAFEQYRATLSEPFHFYVGPRVRGTRERYDAEVAALHVLSTIASLRYEQNGCVLNFWETPDASIYDWYELPADLYRRVLDCAATDTPLALLDQAAEWILAQCKRDYLGEFYTPSVFAEHLVDGLSLTPNAFLSARLVDPACGSGNLLGQVAVRVLRAMEAGEADATAVAFHLNEFFYGFDVHPVAVQLTRLRLILAFLPLLATLPKRQASKLLLFSNIKRLDPLAEPLSYWGLLAKYQYVVGNPPFSKIISERVPYIGHYANILHGQPNLYQLFLWWSAQALVPGGRVAFLTPQSFRSGAYFDKLRLELSTTCDLVAITQFADRDAFEGVDSPLMIAVLQKKGGPEHRDSRHVQIRVSRNGNGLDTAPIARVSQNAILRANGHGLIWHLSDQPTDFKLLGKINLLAQTQSTAREQFEFRNGHFVWNQHKDLLHFTPIDGAIPLIYSSSAHRFMFTFPVEAFLNKSRKQFARVAASVRHLQWFGPCVLVKRTTPKKWGHRVIATLLPYNFYTQYPAYFVENHVNVIQPAAHTPAPLLTGLVGWLNSRLLSFVFQMMNGSAHLSLQELISFPMPSPLIAQLASSTQDLMRATGERRERLWTDLNQFIYDYFELNDHERARINSWIV